MIKSFLDKKTQSLFEDKCPRQFKAFANVAERKLQILDDAYTIEDLRVPPGNRKGQWSIRINDQWRLCFRFENGNAFDVEIVDYH